MSSTVEQHAFQAEVQQVLSIVVNSLYSNKEVFLRELISNASDALDKLSFQALTEHSLLGDDPDPKIDLIANKDQKTLIVRDNGIGMTHDELVENLGTIARSGSRGLMEALAQKGGDEDKLSLIGQFGVGFYSSFLVADKVTVTSRAAGADKAWRWESDGTSGYTIEECEKEPRGTVIILHLKEDAAEFLETWTLRSLVRKYSDFVRHPIRLQVDREQEIEGEKDDEDKPKTETVKEWETVNQANALWTRPKSEVTEEQYSEFYRHLTHEWSDPLAHTHFKVEGTQELTGLLFLPTTAPVDLFERKNKGVRLYVKRVFIMEDCEELLPEWMRFVRGVIDSEDLPLNVSREILQQDRTTKQIRKQIVNKTLSLLEELADEGETTKTEKNAEGEDHEVKVNRYETFWTHFGRVLKEGVHFEPGSRDQIAPLLRYRSSKSETLTSLHDYLGRMDADQPGIYYIVADGIDSCRNSPHLEALNKLGYEVLYMPDPVDEWVVQALTEFEEKKLISAAKGGLDLPSTDEEKKAKEAKTDEFKPLLEKLTSALGDRVSEVRITDRLTDSPACLVTDESGVSPHLERILRANGQDVPEQKRIFEINPEHAVVQKLQGLASVDATSGDMERWGRLLFDQALLAEGTMPKDPAAFAKAIGDLMQKAVD